MSTLDYAKRELDLVGMTEDSGECNVSMRNHILHMVEEFAKEGHSGFSASYAISCLEKVLRFEPLSPLTGEDSEWDDMSEYYEKTYLINNRCTHVYKDESGAWDVNGTVFYDWYVDKETGETYKSYFTNRKSRTPVTFPYTPITVYEEWKEPEED
jgi:hypothetical protein